MRISGTGRAVRLARAGRFLVPLVLACATMSAGFWLKWRHLLEPDARSWYLHSWANWGYTDLVALYLQQGLDSRPIPYLQTKLEYPVMVGLVQYLASLAPGVHGYFLASSLMLALAGIGVLLVARQMNPAGRLWVLAGTPPLLLYAALNWDLLALFFAMMSLLLFQRRREGWSALLLTLGIWTKLFPAVLLPWMLLQRAQEGKRGSAAAMIAIVLAGSVALNLPVYLASPTGWSYFFDFQAVRPPDGGSLWAYLDGWPVQSINRASLLASGAGVLAMALAGRRAGMRVEEYAVGSLALLILLSKVTSPQYDLWLMPFLALAPVPLWLVGLFLGVDVAYFWSSFQTLYLRYGGQSDLAGFHGAVAGEIILARQVVLVLLILWVVKGSLIGKELDVGADAPAGPGPQRPPTL